MTVCPLICPACARRLQRLPDRRFNALGVHGVRQQSTVTPTRSSSSPPPRHSPFLSSPTDQLAAQASRPRPRTPIRIPASAVAYRWETNEPTPAQLSQADAFFLRHDPTFLTSEPLFRNMTRDSPTPEVVFLGRSNVGKSSLLNALLGASICHTSSKPGRTRYMNGISVHDGRLIVLDMPGYGRASREEWGSEIIKYLVGRSQLRRAFLLVDARHGPKETDLHLLSILRTHAIPHQVVLSKVDRVLFPQHPRFPSPAKLQWHLTQLQTSLHELRPLLQPSPASGPPALGEILSCSAETATDGRGIKKRAQAKKQSTMKMKVKLKMGGAGTKGRVGAVSSRPPGPDALGVSNLRFAVLAAVGLDRSLGLGKSGLPRGLAPASGIDHGTTARGKEEVDRNLADDADDDEDGDGGEIEDGSR
ncbi:MAG: hypothetical protein M1838_004031 [Thelocarpon superellum]|nr:MAG: hypothetical protein M1838_004031 [Thelocarpon superellum]